MQYRLRTLLILMAIVPPAVAGMIYVMKLAQAEIRTWQVEETIDGKLLRTRKVTEKLVDRRH